MQAHHEPIVIDLPSDDASASLSDYADIAVRAIGKRANVILVAQSLGGFTAPLVCARAIDQRAQRSIDSTCVRITSCHAFE